MMANPNYSTIILELSSKIDTLTHSFLMNGYKAMSNALLKPIGSLCVLYIVLTGYSIMRGLIKTPMREFTYSAIRMGLIYMFAFNWDEFSSLVVGLFVDGAGSLSGMMMKASHASANLSANGFNQSLQNVFTEIMSTGAFAIQKASYKNVGPLLSGFIIQLSGLAVIGLAFFEILLSKVMMSICLATAPLFISLTLFKQTRSFFDRWLGTVVGFSLLLVFVSTVVGLCLNLVHGVIEPLYQNEGENLNSTDWISLFLVSAFSVMAIVKITSTAKGIGGACSASDTGSELVSGFMARAFRMGRQTSSRTGLSTLAQKSVQTSKNLVSNSFQKARSSTVSRLQKHLRGG